MDELNDLEEILSDVKKISEKLQARKNFLTEEISRLRAENEKILAERNSLLNEMNALLAENERLRKVNATFGKNLAQLPQRFQIAIQNEFQKFLTAASNSVDEENLTVPNETEILSAEENLPADLQESQPKKKMLYAEFYAEEAGFKED